MIDVRASFLEFIGAFLDEPLKSRWAFICQKSVKRWTAIDPYALWTKSEAGARLSHDFSRAHISELLEICKLEAFRKETVPIVSFGHAPPKLYEATLESATAGELVPFEGLVLFRPSDLVFCMTHEGDVRVFESEAHRRRATPRRALK